MTTTNIKIQLTCDDIQNIKRIHEYNFVHQKKYIQFQGYMSHDALNLDSKIWHKNGVNIMYLLVVFYVLFVCLFDGV